MSRTATWRWATVTQVNPLRIRLDGEAAPLPITPDSLVSDLFVGDRVWVQFYDTGLLVAGTSSVVLSLRDRLQQVMTGGGIRSATSAGVSWSQRIIMLGAGRGPLVPPGYFNIDMPPDGTVIPVVGHSSVSSVTVASGAIPMPTWTVLWYKVPFGVASSASIPGNFYITNYSADFEVPADWVMVVRRNTDTDSYYWADGKETGVWVAPSLTNSWVNYGSGYQVARYKREGGRVYCEGLIKSGNTSASWFVFPAGFRPAATLIFLGHASGGIADIRVTAAGSFYCAGYFAGGTNADLSLSMVQFDAAG